MRDSNAKIESEQACGWDGVGSIKRLNDAANFVVRRKCEQYKDN